MYSTLSAMRSHRDPVVDGDGVELRGETALRLDDGLHVLADLVQVHVPRHELRERVRDGDDGPAELPLVHPVRSPERPRPGHAPPLRAHRASQFPLHVRTSRY